MVDHVPTVRAIVTGASEPPGAEDAIPAERDGAGQRRNNSGLPSASHIIALGADGGMRWYLDANHQLISLGAREHSRLHIMALLGPYVKAAADIWPREGKHGAVLGADWEEAAADLLTASGRRLWSPRDRVRGRGFWADRDGGLVVHSGDRVFIKGRWHAPGLHEGLVYPAAESLMAPAAPIDSRDPFAAGRQALELFRRWNWKRKVGARLALGAYGCLVAGGALQWRPVFNINGVPDAGKTSWMKTCDALAGGWTLLTEDASEAGLRQSLRYDSLGLLVDEAEPGDDGRAAGIMRMARRSTGGGKSRRGTASDQAGIQFNLQSTVALGAVDRVGFLTQDVTRRIVLEVDKPLVPLPLLGEAEARGLGAQLLHLLIEGWPRLRPAIEAFRQELIDAGHEGRQALVIATVLGMADILLTAEPVHHDHAAELIEELAPASLPDINLAVAPEHAWLQFFAGSLIPLDYTPTTPRKPVAEWLALAQRLTTFDAFYQTAETVLRQHGIKVSRPRHGGQPSEFWIAGASHPQLARLHSGSEWRVRGKGDAGWLPTALKLPGSKGANERLAGPTSWGAKLPLTLILDEEAAEEAVRRVRQQVALREDVP